MLGLTKAMARELGPDNVRVNAICPGYIGTDIAGDLMTPELLETIVDGVPMGRAGEARDVAGYAGCLARRACPVGRDFPYEPAHAAYHMKSFAP